MSLIRTVLSFFIVACLTISSLQIYSLEVIDGSALKKAADSIDRAIDSLAASGDKAKAMQLMCERSRELFESGEYVNALIILDRAVRLSNGGSDTVKQPEVKRWYMECLNWKGVAYSYLSNYEEAISNFIAMDKFNRSRDMLFQARFENGMGVVFSTNGKIDQAREYYHKALRKAKLIENIEDRNTIIFATYCNLSGVATMKNEFDSSNIYVMEAHKLAVSMKDKKKEVVALQLFGFLNSTAEKYPLAISYYDEAYKLAMENKMYYMIPFIKLNISYCYIAVKDYDKALEVTNEALRLAQASRLKKVESLVFKALSNIYRNKGDFMQAFYYIEQSSNLKDSIFSQQNEEQFMKQKQNFDIYQVEMEKEILNKNLEISDGKRIITNLLALFVVVVSISIFIWFSYKLYIQYKLNKRLNERHSEDINILKDEKEAFEGTIVRKDKDISRYMILLVKMNETGFSILSKLKALRSYLPARSGGYEVIKEIEDMIHEFRFSETLEQTNMREYFDHVSPNFYYKLECRYPDLTASEIKMCALISLGLSTKDLLSVTGKTQSAIDNVKLRIRKKINVDSTINLGDFLSQI